MKNIRRFAVVLILALLLTGCAPFLNAGSGGGYKGGEADFLDLIGVATAEEVHAALGDPDETVENENPGYHTISYRYGDVTFDFEPGENGFVLNGLYLDGPDERFTVGGASVGMTPEQAEASLAQHGFSLLEDETAADTAGGRYYEAGTAGGPDHMIVAVYTGDGLVSAVYGYWNLAAEWALNQLSALGATGETYEALNEMGVATSEDVVAALGEPNRINENEVPGFPIMQYSYTDTLMEFVLDNGLYILSDISCTGPQSPFTVGGAHVGMTLDEAEGTLAQHGFVFMDGVTDADGRRCYQESAANAPYPATILILADETGQVNEVSIYWERAAQWLIENILQGYGDGSTQTGQTNETQSGQKAEFFDVIGANTPEDVEAALGEPGDTNETDAPGYPVIRYDYPDLSTTLMFARDGDGEYLLATVNSYGAASPFTVCGVAYGMALDEAESALAQYGLMYMEGVTDANGIRYYQQPESDDAFAPVVCLAIDENGLVYSVAGYSGLEAEWVLYGESSPVVFE